MPKPRNLSSLLKRKTVTKTPPPVYTPEEKKQIALVRKALAQWEGKGYHILPPGIDHRQDQFVADYLKQAES